jgi:hypothetical protein
MGGFQRWKGHNTPEVDIEHPPGGTLRGLFDLSYHTVTGVIEDDADATYFSLGVLDGGGDFTLIDDVEFEDAQPPWRILYPEVTQGWWSTGGCDCDVSVLEGSIGHRNRFLTMNR